MKKVLIFIFLIFICFSASRIFATDKVEINTASLQQLDKITGIGPALAQRIIDARPFSSVDDLLKVSGIGPKTLQKIKDQGLVYIEGQTQPIIQPIAPSDDETIPTPTLMSTPTASPTPATSPTLTPTITYPRGVFINEVLPSPDGPDETEEWIELKNTNSQEVDIAGWEIKDTAGTIKKYKFPAGSKIASYGFLVLSRPVSKISLNNAGDGLILLWPNGQVVDQAAYGKAPLGQSWNRTKAGFAWSAVLTPAKENIISQPVATGSTKKAPIGASAQETAAVGSPAQELLTGTSTANRGIFSFNWPVKIFLLALGLAVLSAIAVLLLKRFLLRNYSIT